MRKLLVLVVVSMVLMVSAGCQQLGLSQEEVRSIVREEVASQLRDIVEQDVAGQLATMDELTVSRLRIENEDGNIVAVLSANIIDGNGQLTLFNAEGLWEGKIIASLGSFGECGEMYLCNTNGRMYTWLYNVGGRGVLSFDGELLIGHPDGELLIRIGDDVLGNGKLLIYDRDGQVTFEAP